MGEVAYLAFQVTSQALLIMLEVLEPIRERVPMTVEIDDLQTFNTVVLARREDRQILNALIHIRKVFKAIEEP